MYRSKKSKTSLQYKLETSGTLHAPAEGTSSLKQSKENIKGKCRGTNSPEKGKESHIQ
jgi:hypothetical protein